MDEIHILIPLNPGHVAFITPLLGDLSGAPGDAQVALVTCHTRLEVALVVKDEPTVLDGLARCAMTGRTTRNRPALPGPLEMTQEAGPLLHRHVGRICHGTVTAAAVQLPAPNDPAKMLGVVKPDVVPVLDGNVQSLLAMTL